MDSVAVSVRLNNVQVVSSNTIFTPIPVIGQSSSGPMCVYLQNRVDANVNRDTYIPNSACELSDKFEWIGKLMGACVRGKENLVNIL